MSPAVAQIWSYLVAQSGQLVLAFGLIWLLDRMLAKASAHWRYLLWLLVLVKCVMPSVIQLPLPAAIGKSVPVAVEGLAAAVNFNGAGEGTGDMSGTQVPGAGAVLNLYWREAAVLVWAAGAIVFLAVIVCRALRIQRNLRRHRTEPDLELECEFVRLAQLSGLKSRPRLCLIVGISQPFVWGLWRGCIYLPIHFSAQGTLEQRRLVLAHELAHVVRWDAFANALQVIVQAVFWFHPLVWWLNQRLRHEREKCCDEMAVALLNVDSRRYGAALIERVAAFYEKACPSSSLAISGKAKDLEDRLRALMIPGRLFHRGPTLAAIVSVLALGCVLLPAGFARTVTSREEPASGSSFVSLKLMREASDKSDAGVLEFEGLAAGQHVLAGIPFLAADVHRLAGTELTAGAPAIVRCKAFHLLHGLQGAAAEGETVAIVRWRYAGGGEAVQPIVYGEHVRDWQFWNFEPVGDPGSVMAWTGSNDEVRRQGGSLRLYHTRLANPIPGRGPQAVTIAPVAPGKAVPLIVALTAEQDHP